MRGDLIDPPEDLRQRHVLDTLGVLREVAESAVEVAALRDLQGHATDGVAAAEDLVFLEERP
jgi:hypothetical protein